MTALSCASNYLILELIITSVVCIYIQLLIIAIANRRLGTDILRRVDKN